MFRTYDVFVQVTLDPGSVHEEILDGDRIFSDPALYGEFRNKFGNGIIKGQFPVFIEPENTQSRHHLGVGTDHKETVVFRRKFLLFVDESVIEGIQDLLVIKDHRADSAFVLPFDSFGKRFIQRCGVVCHVSASS